MKKVAVVLTQNVKGLGFVGDQIEVKPGYARNFLIPRGLAVEQELANKFKKLAETLKKEREEAIAKARQLANMLSGLTLTFERKVQEKGQIFGSIGAQDIIKALSEKMITIPEYAVKLSSPIKTVGKHSVSIKLHTDVTTQINVHVIEEGKKDMPKKPLKKQEGQESMKAKQAGGKKISKVTSKEKTSKKRGTESKAEEANSGNTKNSGMKSGTDKIADSKSGGKTSKS